MNTGKVVLWTLVGLILVGGGYWAYKKLGKGGVGNMTKDDAIQYLNQSLNWDEKKLKAAQGFGADFLIAWASARKSGKSEFTFDGKKYNSLGRAL